MGQADRPRIVCALGLLQRPGEERNAARRLAARDRQLAVQTPQLRKTGRMQPLALLGRIPEGLCRLADVILLEPGLGQGGADLEGLVAGQPRLLERAKQERGRIGALSLLKGVYRLGVTLGERHAG